MKIEKYVYSTAVTLIITLTGCSEPAPKEIDIQTMCVDLKKIADDNERKSMYSQCQDACRAINLPKMPESPEKNKLRKICVAAQGSWDNQFEPSPERNWLGVMP